MTYEVEVKVKEIMGQKQIAFNAPLEHLQGISKKVKELEINPEEHEDGEIVETLEIELGELE